MSAASLDRRSAKVCPASEKDLSDDVLDAGTLSRPLATSVRQSSQSSYKSYKSYIFEIVLYCPIF